jgi:hypothetical protein
MRYLFIALALTLPASALAGTPCGTQGANVPLNAETRAVPQAQNPGQAVVTPGQGSSGNQKASKQAYPH